MRATSSVSLAVLLCRSDLLIATSHGFINHEVLESLSSKYLPTHCTSGLNPQLGAIALKTILDFPRAGLIAVYYRYVDR